MNVKAIVRLPLIVALCATATWACNVPVFRYALERWPSDLYQITVFHRGPLTPEDEARVTTLQKNLETEGPPNFGVELIDITQAVDDPRVAALSEERLAALPTATVFFPPETGVKIPIWTGAFKDLPTESLIDSPIRRELAKRLLAGQTAVWLFLPCGDAEQDSTALKNLQAEVKKLPEQLKLPELTSDPSDEIAAGGPDLKIDFSVIPLNRDDPAEKMLVNMLLASEDDLVELKEPMAFPVYGRGRALYALVGKGITADNVVAAGSFLTGPCSCEVKRLNPGVDLLMAVNWDVFGAPPPERVPEKGHLIELPKKKAAADASNAKSVGAATIEPDLHPSPPNSPLRMGILMAVVLVVITGVWALNTRK